MLPKVKQKSKKYALHLLFPQRLLCNLYIRQKSSRFFPSFPMGWGKPCGNCVKVSFFKANQGFFVWIKKILPVENFLSRVFLKNLRSLKYSHFCTNL